MHCCFLKNTKEQQKPRKKNRELKPRIEQQIRKLVVTLRLLQVLQVVREYLSLRPISEERIDELEDGAEEFIYNAAHDDRVIENIEEVQKCGGNRKSNVHLLGIPGKLEYRKGNIERNSG